VLTARTEVTDWILIFGVRHLRAIGASEPSEFKLRIEAAVSTT
jgi:hypothetical protein